jgi:hypothetical protein
MLLPFLVCFDVAWREVACVFEALAGKESGKVEMFR